MWEYSKQIARPFANRYCSILIVCALFQKRKEEQISPGTQHWWTYRSRRDKPGINLIIYNESCDAARMYDKAYVTGNRAAHLGPGNPSLLAEKRRDIRKKSAKSLLSLLSKVICWKRCRSTNGWDKRDSHHHHYHHHYPITSNQPWSDSLHWKESVRPGWGWGREKIWLWRMSQEKYQNK